MDTVKSVAQELRQMAKEINEEYYDRLTLTPYDLQRLAQQLDPTYHAYGVIVKANKDNGRFKDTSVWVSLGDGAYKHLSGEKGLIAKYERLNGFVHQVYAV